jgi:hypothetical protein
MTVSTRAELKPLKLSIVKTPLETFCESIFKPPGGVKLTISAFTVEIKTTIQNIIFLKNKYILSILVNPFENICLLHETKKVIV